MIIKATKRIFNSDKICLSYSDLNFGVTFLEHSVYRRAGHRKSPRTITAETMARHDEKTSTGRAKMLSRGDTGDRLAGRGRRGTGVHIL